MKFNIEEKKILYAFGCGNHENTVRRLKWGTALTVDEKAKRRMLCLARKLDGGTVGECMGKRSKYEKETLINFDKGSKEASIYTFNADLKRKLADFRQSGY